MQWFVAKLIKHRFESTSSGRQSSYLRHMNIGYDAKRAFHNGTGLGHYSRTLLHSLAEYYPGHHYYLFNPKAGSFKVEGKGLEEIRPEQWIDRLFPSAWRSSRVKKSFGKLGLDLYHGLSHEIPLGIRKTGVPSVVTIHDLIHERYPSQYKAIDVQIYRRKFKYACAEANRVIAISEQTKQDVISFYGTDPGKIRVCYQSCNPAFGITVSATEKGRVRKRYDLPPQYFLSVGSIIERKNLLAICEAMVLLGNEWSIPLVVIGDGGDYFKKVRDYVAQHQLEKKLLFLSLQPTVRMDPRFRNAEDFPAIYQQATALIYPSVFEGFGIPVLEALWSRIPVITSNQSCLPEAGGPGALYIDPAQPATIATAMKKVITDTSEMTMRVEQGWSHAQRFTAEKTAASVMKVYEELW